MGVVLATSVSFVVALIVGLFLLTPHFLLRGNPKTEEGSVSKTILRFSLPNYASSIMATFNIQVALLILGEYNLRLLHITMLC
jgi:O-antigen/teichoic acid export membrane protein